MARCDDDDALKKTIQEEIARARSGRDKKDSRDFALGPSNLDWTNDNEFDADIHYPAELEKLLFGNLNPWHSPIGKKKMTPAIHLRVAIEKFRKSMPAERKTIIDNITYKYKLRDFSLIEKNKNSILSWEDYSFIAKIKVIPDQDCAIILRSNVLYGHLRFWFKGEIDMDDNEQITDIQLTDITLKATTKPNP